MSKRFLANRILAACGILSFLAVVVVFDLACGSEDTNGPGDVTSLSVLPNPVSARVGGTVTLHADVHTSSGNADNVQVSWITGSASIATVSVSGSSSHDAYVTGVSAGTTSITVDAGSKTVSIPVTISNVPVGSVTVSGPATIQEHSTGQFTATVKDDAGNTLTGRTVSWASSNSSIASVSQTGLVTAQSLGGPVTITATSEFHDGTAQTTIVGAPVATITVTGPATVNVNQTGSFTAVLKDAAGNTLSGRLVDWTSSNTSIATVSQFGTVTGIAVGGPVTITASSETKSGTATTTIVAPTVFSGRVINYVNGAAIGGATVNFRLNDGGIGSLFGSVTSAGDGSFSSPATTSAFSQGVIIEAIANGYVTGRVLISSFLFGGTVYAGDVPLVPTSGQTGGISGTIRNATTGTGLAGASVQVFDNITSSAIASTTSDGSGNFSITNLTAGTYRLTASATGYTTSQRTGVAVGNGGVTANQDLVLSANGTNTVTIVLTWGASPNDLDSHFTGPNADISRFHVYYATRGSLTTAPFAHLDVDDVSAFGPETITLTQMMNVSYYRYSVHDFSNRSSNSSTALGTSGAKVQVYTATGVQTFFVPAQPGTLWTVFELTGTLANPLITPRNQMSFVSDASQVPAPPIDGGGLASDAWLIARATVQHPKPLP